LLHFYRLVDKSFEFCFYIETSSELNSKEINILKWLLSETFQPQNFNNKSFLENNSSSNYKNNSSSNDFTIIEFGPRLNFETSYSTNAVAICNACGLDKILRLERSRRYKLNPLQNIDEFIKNNHDKMTECVYQKKLFTFETGIIPQKTFTIPLLEEGISALEKLNKSSGLGFDNWDLNFYYNLFVNDIKRNPTNVEIYHLSQANSEHSRHWFFKGNLLIDGKKFEYNLIDLIKSTLKENPSNSLVAFKDNSSVIKGFKIKTIIPKAPGFCSYFKEKEKKYHLIFTAETHNFPSGVAPFPGAETGTGGRIRDVQATGRGGLVIAGTAGYATGNLNIKGYKIPGENESFKYPTNLASPLKILIEESNGASDYGNKFGEPVIQGFVRTFGQILPNDERKEWIKPIMFTGGIGQIDDVHLKKYNPKKGMLILQVGGPAYRIGMGGGSASSLIQGENLEELDFNAVQRGNAEMEQKLNRVIRACVEMGKNNPILSIHDQGAGGPCNVITEIINPSGGRVDIRQIKLGDKTMSVLEIWVCEYQERNALLIYPENLDLFLKICKREKVNCEVLGEITGDGKIFVYDSQDNSVHVNLELSKILGNIPKKTFNLQTVSKKLIPLKLPERLTIKDALKMVFLLPSVGSKGYLVRKVDRSVTGLIARQQCCGPLQLPVSDVAVIAQSHFSLTGAAISIGEQPLKIMVDPEAGARMSVAEAITNIMWAKLTDLTHIKCSVNWMWPAKMPGEGVEIVKSAKALCDLMKQLGIAADGGKDSVSMAAQVGSEIVKSPNEVVISAYCTVEDITKVITPDIKNPSKSKLLLIDLANGKSRLGGSALAQCFDQIGNDCPDVEDVNLLKNAFYAIQEMIQKELITAGHDISDGGLITAVSEMIMAGNCGAELYLELNEDSEYNDDNKDNDGNNDNDNNFFSEIDEVFLKKCIQKLFSEELGLIVEYFEENKDSIFEIIKKYNLKAYSLGSTKKEKKLIIRVNKRIVEELDTNELILWWEATSDELEKYQQNPVFAVKQRRKHLRENPHYYVNFKPENTFKNFFINNNYKNKKNTKPKVAIIREEGSNGDREMTSAFYFAGFETWDVTMTDLLNNEISLDDFKGAVFVGGFSYADVLDSAKGWAGVIKFNEKLSEMFHRFYEKKDTFSLGVCNGCQLLSLLGWVPWPKISQEQQPRFISNPSGRFESRWAIVKILESPSIMLKGMEGSILGVWVAHREGHLYFPDERIKNDVINLNLAPIIYVDDKDMPTEDYPFNPNSSPFGITALCSIDGRHLAMMPHPERSFLLWQWPWVSEDFKSSFINNYFKDFKDSRDFKDLEKFKDLKGKVYPSPWMQMFINARKWCEDML